MTSTLNSTNTDHSHSKETIVVCALYKFTILDDYKALKDPLLELLLNHQIKGTLLLAREGINGTIAGSRDSVNQVQNWLNSDARFENMSYKKSYHETNPFHRTKVKLKKEIVTMGVEDIDPKEIVGTYIKPKDWNSLISDPEVLLVDTRNDYEVHIGTFKHAINPKTETFTNYKHDKENPNSISFNDVRNIIEENNNLWIASWGGGLNYYDRAKNEFASFRENINDSTSISSDNIVAMIKTGDTIWLGTYGGGVNLFNTNTKKSKQLKNIKNSNTSTNSNNILSLYKDSKNNVWIGDSEGKINRFNLDTGKFEDIKNNEVVKDQSEVAIIEDDMGNIWFSTENGIYKFDYEIDRFTNFPSLAGAYRINSVFKDDDGFLYFGRSDGVLRFDPNKISNANIQPEVKITNFKLFNEELSIGTNEIIFIVFIILYPD